jgi:hypothetical protein
MLLAPAELALVYLNRFLWIADIFRVPYEMNLHSEELVPVNDGKEAEVMPLFKKCWLVSGARCHM